MFSQNYFQCSCDEGVLCGWLGNKSHPPLVCRQTLGDLQMGANQQSSELMKVLDAEEGLKLRGFTASCGPTGGVIIDRWNHVRGVWHFHEGNFYWTPAGYNEPIFRTDDIRRARQYSLEVICKA